MYLPPWARRWIEVLVSGSCNHFALTAEKGPCVVDGLCWPVFVCVYIYICVCIYIYIKKHRLDSLRRKGIENLVRDRCNHFAVSSDKVPCVVNGLAGLPVCVCVSVYIYIYIK
jgi:hypothetical protein